jgi:hypothetical protein
MESITRLDKVFIFGDKLSFLIPHEWIEETLDDHYLYRRPGTDPGWLRVSLVTSKAVNEVPSQRLERIFASRDNVSVDGRTGNLVCTSEKDSEEKGVPIHLYYWKVANIVLPDLVCEAVFSYTILPEHMDEEKETVKLLGQLASQAEFFRPT